MALCKTHLASNHHHHRSVLPGNEPTQPYGNMFSEQAKHQNHDNAHSKAVEADKPIGYGAFGVVW